MMTHEELHQLRVLYDVAKALKRDPVTGKAYTDRDFANDFLDSNFSMVTKVLTGKAISRPTVTAIKKFILPQLEMINLYSNCLEIIEKGINVSSIKETAVIPNN